jgi:pilus assembly protein CpaC
MFKNRWAVLSAKVGLTAISLLFISGLASVYAQAPPAQPVTFRIDGPTQRLEMIVASSRILTLDQKIPRLLVNNPEIVRATPISPNQVQLSALTPGITQLNVWDEQKKLYTVDVVVIPDARELEELIKSEFPDAAVRIRPLANSVYLTGYVPSPNMVRSIIRMAEDYYPNVINNLTIGGVQQILLKTKVMEVSRTKLRRAGFDWAYLDGGDFVVQSVSGLIAPQQGPAAFATATSDTVRFGIVDGNRAFYGFIDALRRNQLLKVLAEPTLVTVSGRPASFNSGGEFPIIVPQSLGTVSIEYRQFGTRVDFVPIVLGNGNLRLEVRPQISEIDQTRGIVIDDITVPGLRTRWVDTAVEMKAGQTLALAGLIQRKTEMQDRGIPWLADVPWFGAPFRHVQEEVNEVELLIMVTPEFVEATDPQALPPCGPGEATTSPNDVELYFRKYNEVPRCCPDHSCPQCQAADGTEGLIGPPEQLSPQPAPQPAPEEAEPFDPSARGPETQPVGSRRVATTSAQEKVNGPVRVRVEGQQDGPAAAERREAGLIGPVGYDTLR